MSTPASELSQHNKPLVKPLEKPLGFWTVWSLIAGIMIGSGIFFLPADMAKLGMISFSGWIFTSVGAILLAFVFSRLARRTERSGGVYIYAQDAFGDLSGFISGWAYWCGYWISIPTLATAFVGYLTVFVPGLSDNATMKLVYALALMWGLIAINMISLKSAGRFQLISMILKILPLLIIIFAGLTFGSSENLPPSNPTNISFVQALAASSIAAMWAFSGIEAGATPAGNIEDPKRTIPRAIFFAVISVAIIYIAAMYAVMRLVPYETLVSSERPFSDAATVLGSWGPPVIAIGALIAMAGSLNGIILVTGQMPMAMALDDLAPRIFARGEQTGTPRASLFLCGVLATALLILSFSGGNLLELFNRLLTMSMFMYLMPLFMSCLAEMKHSWKSFGMVLAGLAAAYSAFTIFGAGTESMIWGSLLLLAGLPVYFAMKTAR